MKALSLDLRQRIVSAVDEGTSQVQAAQRFCVSTRTVGRLLKQRREAGTLAAKPRPGCRRHIAVEQYELIAAQMRAHAHASLEEHVALWQHEQGQSISDTTLWRTLQRMNWSHKKRACTPVSDKKQPAKSLPEPHSK
jgi:transposase